MWDPFSAIGGVVGGIVGDVAGPVLGGAGTGVGNFAGNIAKGTQAAMPPSPLGDPTVNYGSGPLTPMSSQSGTYNGTTLTTQNAGMMDPNALNPFLSAQTAHLGALGGQYAGLNNQYGSLASMFQNSMAGGAFNPGFYGQEKAQQQGQIATTMANQYANMGLSGSGVELGNMNNALQQNQMAWLNRQQGDQMQAMSGLEGLYGHQQGLIGAQAGLEGSMYGQYMGIQNQYGNFEDTANQNILSMMGAYQAQNAANMGYQGQIAGGVLSGAGMAIGAM